MDRLNDSARLDTNSTIDYMNSLIYHRCKSLSQSKQRTAASRPTETGMDTTLAGILLFDGLTNGAIYVQLAIATVLVFSVTRVIFIPQGEFVTYGALTLASLQAGHVPGTAWLMATLALACTALDLIADLRRHR